MSNSTSESKRLTVGFPLYDDAFVETLQAMVGEDVDLSEVPSVQKRRLAKLFRK